MKKQKLNLNNLLSITMGDIDTFLLMEQDQETDKNKLFTVDEIRTQLKKTVAKSIYVLEASGYDTNKSLKCDGLQLISNDEILNFCINIQNN